LGWLAARVTRVDHPGRPEPNQQYVVRTHGPSRPESVPSVVHRR
jgi:hypothetical protein